MSFFRIWHPSKLGLSSWFPCTVKLVQKKVVVPTPKRQTQIEIPPEAPHLRVAASRLRSNHLRLRANSRPKRPGVPSEVGRLALAAPKSLFCWCPSKGNPPFWGCPKKTNPTGAFGGFKEKPRGKPPFGGGIVPYKRHSNGASTAVKHVQTVCLPPTWSKQRM